jgi:pimeloyl-ACP methyl ester carboxylesterase
MSESPSPVVLVHGAWHGPWCWDRVVPLLRERGIDAITVDLPSMAVGTANIGTHDDTKTLQATLDALEIPAVVVGHSYGGMVVTQGAADHAMVKRLLYLAAYVPDSGESLSDLMAIVPNEERLRALFQAEDGRLTVRPAEAGPIFYNDCDEATIAWATERLRSMSFVPGEVITAAAWRTRPSTYIVCTQDRAILPELQRRMAARTSEVIEIEASHSPFASQPEVVADLIERLARA